MCLSLFDIIFFMSTNAASVAPSVLIVGFVLLLISFYIFSYLILSLAGFYGLPARHKHRLAIYLSAVVGAVIALQSIGELTIKDVLVLVPLVTLGYLYGLYSAIHKSSLDP